MLARLTTMAVRSDAEMDAVAWRGPVHPRSACTRDATVAPSETVTSLMAGGGGEQKPTSPLKTPALALHEAQYAPKPAMSLV